MSIPTRRTYLKLLTGVSLGALAGCAGGDGADQNGEVPGSDYPAIDDWLTESTVGGSDDTYEGTLADRRGQDTVRIAVGATGNGGSFAYAPSAVVVSAGTQIEWSWTGEGNPHNVEAIPAEQLGESDYEFSSGEAEGGSGVKFTRTMGDAGVALYHCEPHLTLGMKGGIAVE